MKSRAIYIRNIEIRDIKTFGDANLNFERPDGTLPHWTLILGDNSIGKSTILQSIVWMKPILPNRNDAVGQTIDIKKVEPAINDEENETLIHLVRRDRKAPGEFSRISATFMTGKGITKKKTSGALQTCISGIGIKVSKDNSKLDDVDIVFKTKSEKFFLTNDVLMFAYGASRTLGKQNISNAGLEDTLSAFIEDRTELYDAEEVLHTINYGALGARKGEKIRYTAFLATVKSMLVSIMPDFENIKDIEISTPRLSDGRMKSQEILITTKHGNKIPFYDFSLGYQSVMSWVLDLSWRLFSKFPTSVNPLAEPAIVIIDELDLHLHPIWQRQIMSNLAQHFPNVQFIATAHSPLMVQAAVEENYAVLQFNEEGVYIENEVEGIDGWRVDQILTSDFFNLKTSRGIKYEVLMQEREVLSKKLKPTSAEKKRLLEIISELSEMPTGETPEEIENRELISSIVNKIKKSKVRIEL